MYQLSLCSVSSSISLAARQPRLQVESFFRLVIGPHQWCEIVSREINDTISGMEESGRV